jgi:Flp pilus assembly protein TadB
VAVEDVTVFLLAMGAFLALMIAAWVATASTAGERERKREEAQRLRRLELEAELGEIRRKVAAPNEKWLLDAQGLEALRTQAPDRYPSLTGGQTPEEFWVFWTPQRIDEWRENRGPGL